MNYRADLHCHSTCSDGTCSPIELLELAKEKGLSALSITDHDTLDAYCDETFAKAEQLGLSLFPGVEFSAQFQRRSIHILGYGVQTVEAILTFCDEHKKRRVVRNREILVLLQRLGLVIAEEELLAYHKEKVIGRPHIAALMVRKGYVATVQEAFDRFLGENKPCFSPGPVVTARETLDVIHQAHGKAFLAHPHFIHNKALLKALFQLDFDGFECYYARLPAAQEKKWVDLARSQGKLISGGSDFHGTTKPDLPLGCSWVGAQEVEKIFGTT